MIPPDVPLKAVATIMSTTFAVLILLGAPRRPPNRYLAFFLLLIAGNQALETVQSYVWATTGGPNLKIFRLATVCASLDPLMLYYFASIYPSRNSLNDWRRLAPVLAASAFFVGVSLWMLPEFSYSTHDRWSLLEVPPSTKALQLAAPWGLTAFTAAVYSIVMIHAVHGLRARPEEPAWRFLAPAYILAAVPLWDRMLHGTWALTLGFAWLRGVTVEVPFASRHPISIHTLRYALVFAIMVAFAIWCRHRGSNALPEYRRTIVGGLIAAGVVVGVTAWLPIVEWLTCRGTCGWGFSSWAAATAIRWIAFGVLASVAVLRFGRLDLAPKSRVMAARALIGAGIVAIGFIALVILQGVTPGPFEIRAIDWVLLAGLLAASQGFRSFVTRVAMNLYGLPDERAKPGRLDAYREAVMKAVSEGRDPRTDPTLVRLRKDLRIESTIAEAVELRAEASFSEPLGVGALVGGRYRVLRFLGRGGSSRVFLARDEVLRRDVALKEVPRDEGFDVEGGLREAHVAGSLRHPHVLMIHDILQRPHAFILVCEYAARGSLERHVVENGPLSPIEGTRLMLSVLNGMAAVHSRGIVHRDLSPSNILLDENLTPKIADFGLAWNAERKTRALGRIEARAGTPEFQAPEQRAGEGISKAVDVYAIGLLFRACVQQEGVPPAIDAVIRHALHPRPTDRWTDTGEMLAAMRKAMQSSDVNSNGLLPV